MSGFSRTFNNVFGGGETHPALAPAAGLSSSQNARAMDRGAAVTDARDYASPNGAMRTHKQAPLDLPTQVYANQSVADIAGTRPSARPIIATKDSLHFNTTRFTSPLQPRYQLPRINSPTSTSLTSDRIFGSGPPSPSKSSPSSPMAMDPRFNLSDIDGARSRSRPGFRPHASSRDTLDVGDINSPKARGAARPPACLNTTDIQGASPTRLHPNIPSPGKGTLRCDDIEGSGPGNFRQQYAPLAFATTTHAGRWPLPATSTPAFSTSQRKTMMTKPIMSVD